jgi:hypothetical protein
LLFVCSASTSGQQPSYSKLRHEAEARTSAYTAITYALVRNNSAVDALSNPPRSLSGSSPRPSPESIVSNFILAEKKFRERLIQFSFKRDVVLQTIGPAGEVTGEYIRNSIFVLDDSGRRVERVVYHPRQTIDEMKITREDIQDLAGSQLFGLETEKLSGADLSYDLSFVREENLNGRLVYLLAVRLKQEPNPHEMRARFFVGQIWIDAVSFQTLKLRGTTEPHGKQRFPVFETDRAASIEDQVFPSQTIADDILHFSHKDVHYRIRVRYYDFKRFGSQLKIVEVDE